MVRKLTQDWSQVSKLNKFEEYILNTPNIVRNSSVSNVNKLVGMCVYAATLFMPRTCSLDAINMTPTALMIINSDEIP